MEQQLAINPSAEHASAPLYSLVRDRVRERIEDGTYLPHAQLPPESQLGRLFGVSRITVRQALGQLENEGLIFKVPGKGTFVAPPKAYQELNRLEGFAESMARKGFRIVNQVCGHETMPATREIARQLGLEAGAPITRIKRIRYLNRKPVSFEVTHLPDVIGERLRHENLAGRDIFLIFEHDFGMRLGHADLMIGAVSADADLAQALDVEEGTALLRSERLTFTADGVPVDFEYLYFRTDSFQYRLQMQWRRAGAAPMPARRAKR